MDNELSREINRLYRASKAECLKLLASSGWELKDIVDKTPMGTKPFTDKMVITHKPTGRLLARCHVKMYRQSAIDFTVTVKWEPAVKLSAMNPMLRHTFVSDSDDIVDEVGEDNET